MLLLSLLVLLVWLWVVWLLVVRVWVVGDVLDAFLVAVDLPGPRLLQCERGSGCHNLVHNRAEVCQHADIAACRRAGRASTTPTTATRARGSCQLTYEHIARSFFAAVRWLLRLPSPLPSSLWLWLAWVYAKRAAAATG